MFCLCVERQEGSYVGLVAGFMRWTFRDIRDGSGHSWRGLYGKCLFLTSVDSVGCLMCMFRFIPLGVTRQDNHHGDRSSSVPGTP